MSTQTQAAPRTDTQVQYLLAELDTVKRQLQANNTAVQRIRSLTQVDDKAMLTQAVQNHRDVLEGVSELTYAVNQMLEESGKDPVMELTKTSNALYHSMKFVRKQQIRQNVDHRRRLSKCRLTKTDVCPCGEHYGIMFTDDEGTVLEENVCPLNWWVAMSRLAFIDGVYSQFLEKLPLSDYLAAYKLDNSR
jgi:hypothetical protein